MLEKPDLPDEQLIACLQRDYSLQIAQVDFLPLGNDHIPGGIRTATLGLPARGSLRSAVAK